MIATLAEVGNQPEFTALQVLDSTPGKIGRLRAGSTAEIALVYQGYPDAARGKRGGRNSAVDSGAQNKHIEMALGKFADVVLAKFQGHEFLAQMPKHVFRGYLADA